MDDRQPVVGPHAPTIRADTGNLSASGRPQEHPAVRHGPPRSHLSPVGGPPHAAVDAARTDTASTSCCPLSAAARARFRQPTQRSSRATQYHVLQWMRLNFPLQRAGFPGPSVGHRLVDRVGRALVDGSSPVGVENSAGQERARRDHGQSCPGNLRSLPRYSRPRPECGQPLPCRESRGSVSAGVFSIGTFRVSLRLRDERLARGIRPARQACRSSPRAFPHERWRRSSTSALRTCTLYSPAGCICQAAAGGVSCSFSSRFAGKWRKRLRIHDRFPRPCHQY